ncbi:MAG: ISNCY family transposase [Chlamydiae bacterium]|nr:ISNCY family transposase [Chlamydiota bacterium]
MKLNKAAKLLNISKSQSIRIKKEYQKKGPEGLISKKIGKPSNNSLSSEKVEIVLKFLNQEQHRDFGPLLTHEYLSKEHSDFIGVSSVRKIMINHGLWTNRKTKSKKVYRLRQRKAQRGELVQVDGSEHDWFEGRGPRCTLLVYIDDATNETFAKFVKSENTWDYLNTTREYIEKKGRPRGFYSDKHSVFRVNQEGALSGDGRTQYGRAMEELGIALICANSPQAKGRVERKNRDFQDRLVKAMRLAKISTIEEGNAFLPAFLKELGLKFDKVPQNPIDAHRDLLDAHDLDRIFCLKHTRKISKSLTLQFNGILYQIYGDGLEYTLRKKEINIFEYQDGKILFENNGKLLKAVAYKDAEAPVEIVSSKELLAALANKEIPKEKKKIYKPGRNHPWKQSARRRSKQFV